MEVKPMSATQNNKSPLSGNGCCWHCWSILWIRTFKNQVFIWYLYKKERGTISALHSFSCL